MTQPQSKAALLFRRKPVEGQGAPSSQPDEPQLKRSIGTFQLTLFGVGATVGTGIFYIPVSYTHLTLPTIYSV